MTDEAAIRTEALQDTDEMLHALMQIFAVHEAALELLLDIRSSDHDVVHAVGGALNNMAAASKAMVELRDRLDARADALGMTRVDRTH
ncbi:hypothetical protein LJC19_07550 [Oxalobacter sp. OttesenSCG-928-P03]|nr:hypothetical protein [Oxalobacter sp. OttesenSCG-928-P03]